MLTNPVRTVLCVLFAVALAACGTLVTEGRAHVAVTNDSETFYYVALTWPGKRVVYPVEPGADVLAGNTIGVAGYLGAIEVLTDACDIVARVQGLGDTHSRLLITATSVSIEPFSNAEERGFVDAWGQPDACGATYPPR